MQSLKYLPINLHNLGLSRINLGENSKSIELLVEGLK